MSINDEIIFSVGYTNQHTHDEGQRTQRLKRYNNNKYVDKIFSVNAPLQILHFDPKQIDEIKPV